MSNQSKPTPLAPEIRSLLSRLRMRIRAYVFLEGLSIAIVWLGLTFWVGLAIDYLPVLVGASEMPLAARAAILILIAGILAWILYGRILRRTFTRLSNRNMAILLERRFEDFHDSLVTAVELRGSPNLEGANPEMLDHTVAVAQHESSNIRLSHIFNMTPLTRSFLAAIFLSATVGGFYAVNAQAFEIWVSRIYLLKDEPWPRNSHIELVGIEVQHGLLTGDESNALPMKVFNNNKVKVAKGSSMLLRVRADAAANVIPDTCTVSYQIEDGQRGRVNMKKIGRPRDGYQNYFFEGKPFKGLLSNLHFDVVGFDHRVSNFTIEVVDSPTVISASLSCTFPAYLQEGGKTQWQPRDIDYLPSGTQLPIGTDIVLNAETNKKIHSVSIYNPETDETTELDVSEGNAPKSSFQYHIKNLSNNVSLEVVLHDEDGVASEQPHRFFITAIPDEAPLVITKLLGIGSMVTPDVIIPIQGQLSDDHGVDRSWIEIKQSSPPNADGKMVAEKTFIRNFSTTNAGELDTEVDFRLQRSEENGMALQAKNKLSITVNALDKFNLAGDPNLGISDQVQLDIVTSDQLLTHLEARELGLRRRFEHVIEEMEELRDSMLRVQSDLSGNDTPSLDPADIKAKKEAAKQDSDKAKVDKESAQLRRRSLQTLRTQQAQQQSQKSSQEILGVSASFLSIREELINNRIDTNERKVRLKDQIAEPLKLVGEEMFSELEKRLQKLESSLGDSKTAFASAMEAVEQSNEILLELEDILSKMLELETYNELLDLVRALISEQEELIDQTKKEQKKQALDLLQ